jgi:hypothetical protein
MNRAGRHPLIVLFFVLSQEGLIAKLQAALQQIWFPPEFASQRGRGERSARP